MDRPALRTAVVRGARLPYVDEGRGPPVVLVHGAMGDHRAWEAQRPALVAAGFRHVALDQRHFGPADWPEGAPSYSLDTHVADLAAFVDGLGAGPVHLVGWSYGGAVALAFAVRHAAALASLFLCEPALMSVAEDADDLRVLRDERAALAPAVAAGVAGDLEEATRRFVDWVDDDPGAFDRLPAALRAMFDDNARTVPLHFAAPPGERVRCADLARLDLPAEVTMGARTRPYFRILAAATARCIPGARLTTIEGARHMAPLEAAAAFNAALLRFLEGCR